MKKKLTWFLLLSKRQFKSISFIILLLLLPLISLGISRLEKRESESGNIKIALYTEEEGIAPNIIEQLLSDEKGSFVFYECENIEQLINQIEIGEAEAGYVFLEGFEDELRTGRRKEMIAVYSSPSSILHMVATEIVYSRLLEAYVSIGIEMYVEQADIFPFENLEQVKQEIQNSHEMIKVSDEVYRFEYRQIDTQITEEVFDIIAVFPVRGIIAVYIFIIGLFAAVGWFKDEEMGVLGLVSLEFRLWADILIIGTPVFWTTISASITLIICGMNKQLGREIGVLFLYSLSVVLFANTVKSMVKDFMQLCGMIPILTIASLIICPVFIDLKRIISAVGILQRFLLPDYYLRNFTVGGIGSILYLAIITGGLILLNQIQYRFKR